jgi:hypothetical protein
MRLIGKHRRTSIMLRLLLVAGLLAMAWIGCTDQSDQPTSPVPQQITGISSEALSMDNPRALAVADVQGRHTPELLSRPDVVGTGIGADARGNPVLLIFTRRVGAPGLPASIDGVPTRVDVVGEVVALAGGYKKEYRPVPGGVSVGNANECASGTIGCIVLKGSTRYMLSNNHVFARVNEASIGEAINQPGRYDAKPICNPTGIVGTLSDFVPINFSGNNTIDAAIAVLTTGSVCAMVNNLYTPSSTVVSPSVGLAVKKVGRTSGLTTGTIAGINVTIQVNYGVGVATFVNQIYVASNFIRSGDSGSMMVTASGNNPVGLNFAGSSGASFANPIGPALQAFGATVCNQ